ncbi:MAG TPA: DUF4124 domain-containing protein [Steroidobacteraceae bacterium]|jgi:hypothetical protein|nr:DUF4124 domain-containing protein [Steroidobacteraceae bacterium]
MRRISFALAALAAVIATADADVYKTVDAQGQAHYSDQWSPGAEVIKGDRARAPSDAPAPTSAPNDHTLAPDPAKAAAAKQVQSDMEALRAEQCKQLKEQYDKVIHARRIYQPQPGDDSSAPKQYMSEADADAERVKTRQAMDEACAGSNG